jgi:hypothetical protein
VFSHGISSGGISGTSPSKTVGADRSTGPTCSSSAIQMDRLGRTDHFVQQIWSSDALGRIAHTSSSRPPRSLPLVAHKSLHFLKNTSTEIWPAGKEAKAMDPTATHAMPSAAGIAAKKLTKTKKLAKDLTSDEHQVKSVKRVAQREAARSSSGGCRRVR